jgi:hypothetical protein
VDVLLDNQFGRVDGRFDASPIRPSIRGFSTGNPLSYPRIDGASQPSAPIRPPARRTERSAPVHGVHTMMMVMTDLEE